MGLRSGVRSLMTNAYVSTQYLRVTDRQTEGRSTRSWRLYAKIILSSTVTCVVVIA